MSTLNAIGALTCERVTLGKLKKVIVIQYPYLKEEVERAHTMDDVMSLFHKKHDKFPRVLELRELVQGLQLDEARKEIDKFDDKRRKIYETISAKDFPKIEPEAYTSSQNVQVRNNVRQTIQKCLASIHNSFFQ